MKETKKRQIRRKKERKRERKKKSKERKKENGEGNISVTKKSIYHFSINEKY